MGRGKPHGYPVAELDVGSHKLLERVKRDRFVDEVLGAVSLPVLRYPVKVCYSESELAEAIIRKVSQ